MVDWKKIGNLFMKKMLGKDWEKLTQKKWEKLTWTEAENEKFYKWAIAYLRKKGVPKYRAEKEVGWIMLQYAPRMKEKRVKE